MNRRSSVRFPWTRFLGSFALLLVAGLAFAENPQSLFVNLTSSEMNRAAMAVSFSHRVLKDGKKPTTIFLNVDGVRLANKNIPQNTHVNGKTIQDMLRAFMADGGKVIICPMCMKNVGGMKQEDLMEGVVIGGADITWPALFAEDVTVLSY